MSDAQENAWDLEYRSRKMLSPSNVPHADVVRFTRWLKKRDKKAGSPRDFYGQYVLDLGSGTGRNSFYYAQQGAVVQGFELSNTALTMAGTFARHADLPIEYRKQDIGKTYPVSTASIDLILDITSSNSLMDDTRAVYLSECARVLKPGGWMLVRALSKEGDAHAKALIAADPGADLDSYVHPDLNIVEKTFTRASFREMYGKYFDIIELDQIQHYVMVAGRRYKRNYFIAYLQKPFEPQ